MDEIRIKQYENLRKCFDENLVIPILGKGYYNMASDVYDSDKCTTEDIKAKFDSMKMDIKLCKILLWIFVIISIVLAFYRLA